MAVTKRVLGLGKYLLVVAGVLLATSPLNAQSCIGTVFCTNYGYQCTTQGCDPVLGGSACCHYSCVRPGPVEAT